MLNPVANRYPQVKEAIWLRQEEGYRLAYRLWPFFLKKFVAVDKHYEDITEDPFDFNLYCMRKMTRWTYVDISHFQQICLDGLLLVYRCRWFGTRFEFLLVG